MSDGPVTEDGKATAVSDLEAVWGPRRVFRVGAYTFSRYEKGKYNGRRRWEANAHGRGVGNCWTPVDAFFSLRRWLKEPSRPV